MAYASGVRVRLSYVAETTRGTTPGSPSMKTLRATERAINLTKGLLETAEVRVDRQIADQRHGFNQVGGTIGFEVSLGAYDDMLAALLGGTWTTSGNAPKTGSVLMTVTAYNPTGPVYATFALGTGSFWTLGFSVGMTVDTSGFATGANNQTGMVILAISANGTTATVDNINIVAEASSTGAMTCEGEILTVSNVLQTFTFERAYTDLTQYEQYEGVTINDAQLEISPTRMVGGSFTMLGMSATVRSSTSLGTPSAAPTNVPYSAFDAKLYLYQTAIVPTLQFGAMTSMRINFRNNRQVQPVISSKFSPDVFDGRCMIDGDASFFLQTSSFLDQYFYNETDYTVAVIKLIDLNGNYDTIIMPRIKINSAPANPPQEGPVTFASTFAALLDETYTGYEMIIQRSNT